MSRHAAVWLAWALCALSLALTALSLLLLTLNLSHPNTHLFESWLDNTLTAVFYVDRGCYRGLPPTREPRGLVVVPIGPRHQHELL